LSDLPDWMEYASTSEIERYTALGGQRQIHREADAEITIEMHKIKSLVKLRKQRAKRNQLAAE